MTWSGTEHIRVHGYVTTCQTASYDGRMTPETASAQATPARTDSARMHPGPPGARRSDAVGESMTHGADQGPALGATVSWRPAGAPTARTPGEPPAPVGGPSAAAGEPAPSPPSETAPSAPGSEPTRRDSPLVPTDRTPTEQDLPVITGPLPGHDDRTAALLAPDDTPAGPGPLYVVGDIHGYLDELLDALRASDLVDAKGHWTAGNARLWFLGDFTDRGPDGIGVIELVMQLSAEAAAAGGYARALMGNHELLLLGAHRFGDTPVNSPGGTASFLAAWRLNGGQPTDIERLEDRHLTWMSRLDAAHLADDHLLVHSDTTAYLDYGRTIDAVNDAVTGVLQRGDADECWELFRKFTKRFAFRGKGGPQSARELLDAYGGRQVVHGHSPIPYLRGVTSSEPGDGEPAADAGDDGPVVTGPMVYADGLAMAMDGGVTMDGRLLVARLPLA